MRFGAFIITYNRPEILPNTIRSYLEQTFPPDHILIVDNSETPGGLTAISDLDPAKVTYIATQKNTGPAGGAHLALGWFKEKDFDWVCWGDDDNPPEIKTTFERLHTLIRSAAGKIGIAGAVGQRFSFATGNVVRIEDEELSGPLYVDIMAGASYMVINMQAVNSSTLPDPRLFFGFEEFEFCLKIRTAGYLLLVDGSLMKEYRILHNRLGMKKQRRLVPDQHTLWRQYYSTRNLIFIFLRIYPRYWHIALFRILAAAGKAVFGFRNGMKAGKKNARYQVMAVAHGLAGKMGAQLPTTDSLA